MRKSRRWLAQRRLFRALKLARVKTLTLMKKTLQLSPVDSVVGSTRGYPHDGNHTARRAKLWTPLSSLERGVARSSSAFNFERSRSQRMASLYFDARRKYTDAS